MKIVIENDREHPEDVDALAAYVARHLRGLGFTVEHAEEPYEPGDVPLPNRVTDLSVRLRDSQRAVTVVAKGARAEKPKRVLAMSPEQRAEVEARVKARAKLPEEPTKTPEKPSRPRRGT